MNSLDSLNPMQREAVLHTEGPVLILAGAGSGKTRALTHRVAYLIDEKGVNPWNILAITFTNKAAGEMRERVNTLVGYGAESVWVSTFHALCVRILRRFIENLGYETDFTIYDADDSRTLMRQCIKNLEMNDRFIKERNALSVISAAKNEYQFPEEFADMAEREGDFRLKKIAELYFEYQKQLRKNNALDFDDLLMKAVELFEAYPEILEYYQERFRYIMVDEYQDTNTVQFKLVSLLASRYRNLCVVGDDDQSIYSFRGANIRNILSFEEVFPGAKVIKLEQNYRSTKLILEAANQVIKNNGGRKEKTLWTDNEPGEKLRFLQFDTAQSEARGIMSDILKDGGPLKDYAVLYRTNAQSRLLEESCIQFNLPYRLVGGVNFYQRREIKDILSYLKTIAGGKDDLSVQRIINVPKRGIGETTVARVTAFASANGMSFYDALLRVQAIPGVSKAAEKIDRFTDQIGLFRRMLKEGQPIKEIIEAILTMTGYQAELMEEGEVEAKTRLENIEELVNKAVSYWESAAEPSLTDFLEEVALVADIDSLDESEDRITLMTLHAAKGLEFPVVYLSGMEDGLFPSKMAMEGDHDGLEEERRLCYVGITRAERRLTFTAARKRMVRGDMYLAKMSRFLDEISDELLETKSDRTPFGSDRIRQEKITADADEGGLPWNKKPGFSFFGSKKPSFGKAFTVKKAASVPYRPGDRVTHKKFGSGTVLEVSDRGRDYEVTVEFDRIGVRKMFASFLERQE